MRLRTRLLIGSLLLNAGLALWLIAGPLGIPGRPHESRHHESNSAFFARVERGGLAWLTNALPEPPPFLWRDIESTNYLDYISRLRGVGCPEAIIKDLITADVAQVYATRAAAIWQPVPNEYWKKVRNDRPDADQLKRLIQLDQEGQELQKALLGSGVRRQELIDLAFLQLHGPEQTLAWLPDAQRTGALVALERAGYFAEEDRQSASPDSQDFEKKRKALQNKLIAALEGVLTPEQSKELRMRSSDVAGSLKSELRYFDASQPEFDALVALREKMADDKSVPQDFYARKAAENDAAKQIFGEERGNKYERNSDLFYFWAREASERFGLPEGVAADAWEVKRAALADADQVRRNTSWSKEEKKHRLQDLQRQAETRVNEILGAKAARFARKGDGVWLQILAERTDP